MIRVEDAWTAAHLPWLDALVLRHQGVIDARLKHGDLPRWSKALAAIPTCDGTPHLGREVGLTTIADDAVLPLTEALKGLMPWRKGPFRFGSVFVDTEWRSDLKWDRIANVLDLRGHRVLDVGSGSGYHLWRMLEAGAREVLGIDPSLLFHCQFAAVKGLIGEHRAASLPVTLEQFDPGQLQFDSVFSMGVLYHRKDPMIHLEQLKSMLAPGGQLLVETLVVEGDAETCLVPPDRYARMNNVWFLPSIAHLTRWLTRVGFNHVELVDVSTTTLDEQRKTDWMQFESFEFALDPDNPSCTVEGLPRPRRAALLARAL